MAKTENDLARKVLEKLSVIGAGQSPEAADLDLVVQAYRYKYAELEAPGLEYVYWTLDAIPDAIFLILCDLVKLEVAGDFGQPIAEGDKDAAETVILRRLRRHVASGATGLPAYSEYM